MTEKRFKINEYGCIVDYEDNLKIYFGAESVVLLNRLAEENKQLKNNYKTLKLQDDDRKKYTQELKEENGLLKSELKIYRKIANCSNCHYHNYDTLFGGDEDYEVCDKGNDVTDGICEDWGEL